MQRPATDLTAFDIWRKSVDREYGVKAQFTRDSSRWVNWNRWRARVLSGVFFCFVRFVSEWSVSSSWKINIFNADGGIKIIERRSRTFRMPFSIRHQKSNIFSNAQMSEQKVINWHKHKHTRAHFNKLLTNFLNHKCKQTKYGVRTDSFAHFPYAATNRKRNKQ